MKEYLPQYIADYTTPPIPLIQTLLGDEGALESLVAQRRTPMFQTLATDEYRRKPSTAERIIMWIPLEGSTLNDTIILHQNRDVAYIAPDGTLRGMVKAQMITPSQQDMLNVKIDAALARDY